MWGIKLSFSILEDTHFSITGIRYVFLNLVYESRQIRPQKNPNKTRSCHQFVSTEDFLFCNAVSETQTLFETDFFTPVIIQCFHRVKFRLLFKQRVLPLFFLL